MPRRLLWILLALLLALQAMPAALAEDDEDDEEVQRDVPIEVSATLDASEAAATGMVVLKLTCRALEDIDRPYRVELKLMAFRRPVVNLDHAPNPPVGAWKKGQTVTYEMPSPLPVRVKAGAAMGFFLGFHDPKEERTYVPRSEGQRYGNLLRVAKFEMPDFGALEEGPMVESILAAAADLAGRGREADAWSALELGIRRSTEDGPKYRFRDAILKLGHLPPRPISIVEQGIIRSRIKGEQERYLRLISSSAFRRKQYHACLRILEAIGGRLSEDAETAVIGDVDAATRTQRDITDLKVRILQSETPEDKALVEAAVKANGYTKALYEKAEAWAKKKMYAPATLAFRGLALNSADGDVAGMAVERRKVLEAAWLQDTPPEQQKVVDDALNHPVWARTTATASHKFIFIGPTTLVESLPPMSKLRFDLAYVFLTNLFGRKPNPGGDRVTVYFKELWDFGGGVGGGKIINIGKADPAQKGRRIDNGLLYHELTHCIDDTSPIIRGWREGLANFGAAYAYEALGQTSDSLHGFQRNLRAFQEDYLDKDVAYWRMHEYGPSAGFFLHFVEKFSKKGRLHDWKPYRQFFREYRAAPLKDGRAPYVARAVAYFLIRAFGPKAFDDLLRFRLPLLPDDRDAVKMEAEAFAQGGYAIERSEPELRKHHGSPIPRDMVAGKMMAAFGRGKHEEAERISREELGVIHTWKVVGPFKQPGVNPGPGVFPPEYEIDYTKEYPGEANVARWRDPQPTRGIVARDSTGWIHFNFAYQENTATYALAFLTAPEAQDAFIHMRADDDVTVWLNDRLIENYMGGQEAGSQLLAWRGPYAPVPDAQKLAVRLEQGRNKLLVKIRNRRGKAGFILAVARPNGAPIKGMTVDAKASPTDASATDRGARKAAKRKLAWKSALKMNFKRKSFSSKLAPTVGTWKVENKLLAGRATNKGVAWRKYTVRPGFPKDSPSNLIWIKPKYTKDITDLRLTAKIDSGKGAPKFVLTIQGDGGKDGLSGWNLIVHPKGRDKVGAQLERYDHLYYQVAPQPVTNDKDGLKEFVFTYHDGHLTVTLGGATLFDSVSLIAIPKNTRIGISTWGAQTGFATLELETLPKKKK
ncbi:MAG: hypothetical protein P1V36_13365 [Planctomycetota bacterium]|nr:hypothetical protein [Planctomycetota bacterium]